MSSYNRVLIPMDLALGKGGLSPAVRRIVNTCESEITLLHVVESQPWWGRNGQTVRLMMELELFAHRQFQGARISRRVEWGRPADCILNAIRTARMDMLLMSAGHVSLDGSALGPVASEVLDDAPCPVLLEWAESASANRACAQPVCCAIEFDGCEEAVLGEAVSVVERMDAPLKVICALVPGVSKVELWNPAERERQIAAVRLRVEELCARRAPGAEVHVDVGLPGSVISRAIRLYGAGLLVTGGSREALLAAESECPVLYVGSASRLRAGGLDVTRPAEFAARRSA
jgi:nucleotide-binding universal stress UspA family protein